MITIPRRLYHGTGASNIANILKRGIAPRGRGPGNWDATVRSHSKSVYLTDTYALYFAMAATPASDDPAIIDIATAPVLQYLHADEDALEQAYHGRDELDPSWDIKRRTIWYRSRAHLYPAKGSLNALGTCAHRGVIPSEAILRICVINRERVPELVMRAFDPVICL